MATPALNRELARLKALRARGKKSPAFLERLDAKIAAMEALEPGEIEDAIEEVYASREGGDRGRTDSARSNLDAKLKARG